MPDKIRFGVYELDRDAMELRKHGVTIRLQEQPLRVLATWWSGRERLSLGRNCNSRSGEKIPSSILSSRSIRR